MAGSKYEFWLTDDSGVRLADGQGRTLLDNILNGTFQRVDNGIARFSAGFPASFDTSLIRADRMIQVWRAPEGGTLSLFRTYFIRWWQFARIGSRLAINLAGPDVNDLLRRRVVVNYEDTFYSERIDQADDLMKFIVTNNYVTDNSDPAATFGSRILADFTVQPDAAAGPILYKSFPFSRVIDVIQQMQRDSRDATPEIFWQIKETDVSTNTLKLQFQTKTGQPGADRTAVVFDEARGNMTAATETNDWMDEENYIYGGGQGVNEFRVVEQVYNATRHDNSRYGRSEGFAYASPSASISVAQSSARSRLIKHRNLRIFTAQAVDTEGTIFGRDWNWGDRVTARFLGREGEAIVRRLILTIDGSGKETIDAPLEYVE